MYSIGVVLFKILAKYASIGPLFRENWRTKHGRNMARQGWPLAKLNELSIHSDKKKDIAGHEDVENPRKNRRGDKGMDAISSNVIMHVCQWASLCVHKPQCTSVQQLYS
jgi:hypothetical protein